MAERQRKEAVASAVRAAQRPRTTSAAVGARGSRRPASASTKTNTARPRTEGAAHTDEPMDNLAHREADYMRMNAELERRTADIVYRAEQAMKASFWADEPDADLDDDRTSPKGPASRRGQRSASARSHGHSRRNNVPDNRDDASAWDQPDDNEVEEAGTDGELDASLRSTGSLSLEDVRNRLLARSIPDSSGGRSRPQTADTTARPGSQSGRGGTAGSRPRTTAGTTTATTRQSSAPAKPPRSRTGSRRGRAVAAALEKEEVFEVGNDPVLQAVVGGDLSDDAALRVLKAKVGMLQQELEATAQQLQEERDKYKSLKQRQTETAKTLGETEKSLQNAQQQLAKQQRSSDTTRDQLTREQEKVSSLTRELDQLRQQYREDTKGAKSLQARLQRVEEERDRLKSAQGGPGGDHDRGDTASQQQLLDIQAENKQLKKQSLTLFLSGDRVGGGL
ncbi:uncharacterized protein MONBRDRAFT_27290 [Monosiga brevicollis MX1]|uniref:Uncharacterized protein n=1 Tax=Monosiga brevicollis TaxID=81824 RepID=A9V4V5_MONBE|nr:uncharacterized protein MONBRDRAFT_27290 [Monosiga brevicollis MX1]EDQ87435.1 predicted protein [Monosiga brevicollis MX1]|eukprot:XP_001747695.1 hypothetical protein [Monosiga brevicollis MX1]